MAGLLKVGVKYCGNCNPTIETKEVWEGFKENIKENIKEEQIEIQLVSKDDPSLDILLVISGCPVDCASHSEGEYTEIRVAGETIDRVPCPVEELPLRALALIKKIVNCRDKESPGGNDHHINGMDSV